QVLVTGGAGFIGGHVVDALLAAGHQVRVLDALLPAVHPQGWPAHLDSRAEQVHGDVRAMPGGVLDGIDAISHQAAVVGLGLDLQDLPLYVGVNELGTAELLAAADRAGIGRVVLASSMVVYGDGRYTCPDHGVVRPPPRARTALEARRWEPPCPVCGRDLRWGLVPEAAPVDPRSVYAATKTAQEHLSAAWARNSGGSVVALRYHNVYGPHMPKDTPYAGVASIFRSAAARGRAPRVFEDGGQQRDFVHVRDVARANVLALTGPHEEGALVPYNVASGTPHTILDVATAIAGEGPPPVVTGDFRLGDVRHVVASAAAARDALGFAAEVPFADGMREFVTAPLRGDPGA
ncbi:MAG: putative epimerase, partial [Frankiales bacterium]|nr:putative epimerase [Frankiales bacterium]